MPSLKTIIERNDTHWGRVFDLCIQSLILISLLCFSLETMPGLSAETYLWLERIEVFTILVFTLEYVLRLWVADQPLRYATSFYGLVDLLAILPFYVSAEIDLRSLRAIRFMLLFQAFKLGRYSKAIRRFHRAFLIAKEEIVLFLCATVLLLYFAAVGIYYFESDAQPTHFTSVFHSLWWSVETLTTVGYGDIAPVTAGGKVFTLFILLIGLGIVSVPAGLVASALSKARAMEE
jgi:voltage-gated potassium channel